MLEPHFTDAFKPEGAMARRQAQKDLDDENAALPEKIRQIRAQPAPR